MNTTMNTTIKLIEQLEKLTNKKVMLKENSISTNTYLYIKSGSRGEVEESKLVKIDNVLSVIEATYNKAIENSDGDEEFIFKNYNEGLDSGYVLMFKVSSESYFNYSKNPQLCDKFTKAFNEYDFDEIAEVYDELNNFYES